MRPPFLVVICHLIRYSTIAAFITASKVPLYFTLWRLRNTIRVQWCAHTLSDLGKSIPKVFLRALTILARRLPWWALIIALLFAAMILPFYGAMQAVAA